MVLLSTCESLTTNPAGRLRLHSTRRWAPASRSSEPGAKRSSKSVKGVTLTAPTSPKAPMTWPTRTTRNLSPCGEVHEDAPPLPQRGHAHEGSESFDVATRLPDQTAQVVVGHLDLDGKGAD